MENKHDTLESQLFDWNGWDPIDAMDCYFYNCTLKKEIGNFKVGEKFSSIAFIMSKAIVELYQFENDKDKLQGIFRLKLEVGEKLD